MHREHMASILNRALSKHMVHFKHCAAQQFLVWFLIESSKVSSYRKVLFACVYILCMQYNIYCTIDSVVIRSFLVLLNPVLPS